MCVDCRVKTRLEGSQSEAANLVHVKAHAAGTAPPRQAQQSAQPHCTWPPALTLIALGASGSILYRGEASWTVHP